ncbi:MAG: hypothetical protein HUU02_06775, partial [Bacteroidetes bacterium]|nr:hypothetical protein [Bacteroidota bacterium]
MLRHEVRYWLLERTTCFAALLSFLTGAVLTAGNAGLFNADGMPDHLLSVTFADLFDSSSVFLKLFIFVIPSIASASFLRERKHRFHHLMFSYPIPEQRYVLAKLLGSHAALFLIMLSFGAGIVAVVIGSGPAELFSSSTFWTELLSLLILSLLPNILLVSSTTAFLTVFSGTPAAGYSVPVIFLLVREALLRVTAAGDSHEWRMFDPFGESIVQHLRTLPVPENGASFLHHRMFLVNRMVWGAVTIALYGFLFRWFSFARTYSSRGRPSDAHEVNSAWTMQNIPSVRRVFTIRSWWHCAVSIGIMEWKSILRSGTFRVLAGAGAVLIAVMTAQINRPFGVALIPATWVMLAFPLLFTSLLVQFITFLYAGIVLERPAATRMAPLIDASPVPAWTLGTSKLITLTLLQSVLLAVLMVIGIIVQLFQDAGQIEPGHYLFDLFVLHLSGFVVWSAAALFVHTLTAHTGIGLIILLVGAAGISQLPLAGVEHPLLRFNRTPYDTFTLYYSEMSGYGHSLLPFLLYRLFWIASAVLLLLAGIMFWRRGHGAPLRFDPRAVPPSAILLVTVVMITSGLWIGGERADIRSLSVSASHSISGATRAHQPRVVRTQLTVDIDPDRRAFTARGRYTAINQHTGSIDSLIISFHDDVVNVVTVSVPSTVVWTDAARGVMMFALQTPLEPNDSLTVRFDVRNRENTLFTRRSPVLSNGTYFTSLLFPSIGIRNDSGSAMDHYRSFDSDRIEMEIDISTSSDQTAIAPGELIASWTSVGRNHFRYRPRIPVTNDAGFVSARYTVIRDRLNGIDLEVYHHPDHDRSVRHLLRGMKAALQYCTEQYGPYPHSVLRYAEFSRAAGEFAQSFPAFIPGSELGFMVDAGHGTALNIPFLGAAHETAHQWWGMQALPADLPGTKMITEGMAEFVSMKAHEREFGREASLRFLERSSVRYYSGRYDQVGPEPSLLDNPGNEKAFIPYHKGVLAFHAAETLAGDSAFAASVRGFFLSAQRSRGPYATSRDMFEYIVRNTPDTLRPMLTEWFVSTAVVHASLNSAVATRLPSGAYAVDVSLTFRKSTAD